MLQTCRLRPKDERTRTIHTHSRSLRPRVLRPEIEPGQVFAGRYMVTRTLGRGGTSVVHAAMDTRLKRAVVLKIVAPYVAVDPQLRAMFTSEGEAMARLRHPNVVEIYDIGEHDGCPYLVMPYLAATDLARWARAHGGPPLTVDMAVSLLSQACAGVVALHRAGLVHGDIKPSNILVSKDGRVRVADLGLSRAGRGRDRALPVLGGTPGYLAPELVSCDTSTLEGAQKADVYALAATAHWLLAGHRPCATPEPADADSRIASGEERREARPRTSAVPSARLPEPLAEALRPALHLDPAVRPDVATLRASLLAARDRLSRSRAPSTPFVVLVDDDPLALDWLEQLVTLLMPSAEVVALLDSTAALELIRERTPDLVITDLQMPGLDGLALTGSIRAAPATRSVPVVVMTAVGGSREWARLREAGASRFLIKPLDLEMLTDVVMRLLPGACASRARS